MDTKDNQTANFDKHYKITFASVEKAKLSAHICAVLALEHFRDHGNLVLCQRFLDGMKDKGKNFLRVQPYLKWLVAFAPIKLEGGRLLKDDRASANVFNVEAATKIKFWDFAPEQVVQNYSNEEVFKTLRSKLGAYLKANVTPEVKDTINNLLKMVDQEEKRVASIQPATTAAVA